MRLRKVCQLSFQVRKHDLYETWRYNKHTPSAKIQGPPKIGSHPTMLYGNIGFSCVLPHKSGDDLEFGAEEMRKRTTAIAINSFQITTQCDFKQFSEGHIHLMQVFFMYVSICTLLFFMAHSVFNQLTT